MKPQLTIFIFIFLFSAFSIRGQSEPASEVTVQSESWNIKVSRAKEGGESLEVHSRANGKLLSTYKPPFRTQHFNTAEEIDLEKYNQHLVVMLWDSGPHGQILIVLNPALDSKKAMYQLESSGPITFYAEDDHLVINYYALDNPRGDSLDEVWSPGTSASKSEKSASGSKP